MAVAIDFTGGAAGATSATSISVGSVTIGAGSNRVLVVGVSQYANPDQTPSSVVLDPSGVNEALTLFDSNGIVESPGTRKVFIYYKINPSSVTSKSVTATWGSAINEAVVGATSWTGADQTTPLVLLGTTPKPTGNGPTSLSAVGSVATGDVGFMAISADAGGSANLTSNQTQRYRAIAAGFTTEGAGQSANGAGASITFTFSGINGGSGGVSAGIGFSIKAAGGGGGTVGRLVGGTLCGGVLVGGLLLGN